MFHFCGNYQHFTFEAVIEGNIVKASPRKGQNFLVRSGQVRIQVYDY